MVKVELVYVTETKEILHEHLSLNDGSTVSDALHASKMGQTNPEIFNLALGIFAKKVSLSTPLKMGDRIEIYRPLRLDPKEKRRQRARGTYG